MLHVNSSTMARSLLAATLVGSALAQFDWGSGCGGGTGQPFSVTLAEGASATVGTIPPGKWQVQIFLTSSADVDVQLEDLSNNATVPLIAWCATRPASRAAQISAGCGLLPTDSDTATEESVSYGGLTLTYSGYGGTNGRPGDEFITMQGVTSSTLRMKAFAFQAGSADVTYSWGRVQTGCCMGVAPCGGSFTSSVARNAYVTMCVRAAPPPPIHSETCRM
jgi:hypothetical protein